MPWLSKRDRERLDAMAEQREQYRRLAGEATTDGQRRHYEQLVRDGEAQMRVWRTYPFNIWLMGMAVVVALLPWALLTRGGHPGRGLAARGVVVAAELVLVARSRRRRRAR